MAKLYFRHGAMDSSKSANLLMAAYNYKKQGKVALILKPSIDSRSGKGYVESRIGVRERCIDFGPDQEILSLISDLLQENKPDCILVDECQFLTKAQVLELVKLVDEMDIPVICYGLKNSFIPGKLFEGSEALLYYAESIEEIKTVCTFCDKKATMNLRIVGDKPVYSGNEITVGDTDSRSEEYYIPTCRKHYMSPPKNIKDFKFK